VITSDVRFAGTTADVLAEFEGEAGKFGPEALESASSNFSRAKRDDFVLRAADIGKILKVRIWHANNALTGSDWHLQVHTHRA
jgi:lipoxygenase homology domain-containing protein 1